ncbi:MAG: amidohydrolase family protein [Candidatus Aminicenantales bacterium]
MKKVKILTAAIGLLAIWLAGQGYPQKILIKNAVFIPVVGEDLERGSLLIEDGKIAAIGRDIPVPEGTEIIDASGMFVYPGFIDAFTHFGLLEIGAIGSTVDVREMGKENPELRVAWAINPQSIHFATSRINGTTTAVVAPQGGTFPGLTALIKMDGWTFPEMRVQEVATSMINFPMTPRPPKEGGTQQAETKQDVTSKLVEKIKEYLDEARRYLQLKKLASENPAMTPPAPNPKYEALAPVLDGSLPVIVSVEKSRDIELALKFIKEQKLKAIFRGCAQGFKVADQIQKAGIPVIIDNLYTNPSEPEDGYDAPYRNVAELAKAGVLICFSSGEDPSTGKDLPYQAAKAVAFGLDRTEAIKALTINPARIFGLASRLGSLEPGKDADLFITTGDPLDFKSEVKYLFINGKPIDLDNWWETLYDKWKSRPIK